MRKGTIIYIGGFRFPDRNAAAKLALNYARIFSCLGYNVVFYCADELETDERGLTKRKVFDYDVWSFNGPRNVQNRLSEFLGIKNILSVASRYDDVQAMIFYNYRSVPFLRMIPHCRKSKIKVISNTTEWYGKSGRSVAFELLRSLDTNLRMRVANKNVDGLIVTSTFLKDFYYDSEVVVVPSLSESVGRPNTAESEGRRGKVRLVYAGRPFSVDRKIKDRAVIEDRLDKAISYLYRVSAEGQDFQFDIYGITRQQYLTALPEDQSMLDALENKIFFHGFVTGEAIYSAIRGADFTFLVRDINRVTLAGFPTKIAESINLGIPVLTSRIGDMDKYVVEGQTGFFLEPDHEDYNISVLRRVLAMDCDEIDAMKRYCRKSTVFRAETWIPPVAEFLNRLKV